MKVHWAQSGQYLHGSAGWIVTLITNLQSNWTHYFMQIVSVFFFFFGNDFTADYCLALAALLCRVLSDPTCTVNFPGKFTEGCLIVPVMLFPLGLESSKCVTLYSLGFNAKD